MIDDNLRNVIKYSHILYYLLENNSFFISKYKNLLLKELLAYDNNFDSLRFLEYEDHELMSFLDRQLEVIFDRLVIK